MQHGRASHTKYIYIKSTTNVRPLVGIGTLPPPLSPASVPLPPGPNGGGDGGMESQFRRLKIEQAWHSAYSVASQDGPVPVGLCLRGEGVIGDVQYFSSQFLKIGFFNQLT
jgi:hypothetical protein